MCNGMFNGMVPVQVQPGTLPVWIPAASSGLGLSQYIQNMRPQQEEVHLTPLGAPGMALGGLPPSNGQNVPLAEAGLGPGARIDAGARLGSGISE